MDGESRMCPHCGVIRSAADFPDRGSRGLDCRRAAGRAHYRANRAYYLAKARRRQKRVVLETREWLLSYLREHACVDCGNDDVRVLEFDHRDEATKLRAIAILAGQGFGLARVKAEIGQCDVRCANCHRIRTHLQRGWWGKDIVADATREKRARRDSNPQPPDP
jgi:hypothetical protein